MPFGKHLIIDGYGCNSNCITNKDYLQAFINVLVIDKLKMKKMGETTFIYFEDNEFNRERDIIGYSIIQVISLSSITLHINEISKTFYLDIFTCGDLNKEEIKDFVYSYLKPKGFNSRLLNRDAYSLDL